MRTILFFSVLMLSLSGFSQTVTFDWAKGMGGLGYDVGVSIAADASGNVYTTGYFDGTVDFDPGVGVSSLTSNGLSDIFIQKIDANGNFIWAKQMGGYGFDGGSAITLDDTGNVYTTGRFFLTVDFDPGAGVSNLTSHGNEDIFIQKLNTNGNFIWVKQMGGLNVDYGVSITLDSSGNVFTTGCFYNTVDFDPGPGVSSLTSNGSADVFIQKLDANGNFLWVKQMGSFWNESGNSSVVDASGNVYTTGCFEGTVDFDPGAGVSNLTSNGLMDIFIQKIDANGNFLWVKKMGGERDDFGNSIALDAFGNVHTTGTFYGAVDFNPGAGLSNLISNGAQDVFIQKLDASGNFLWAKQISGEGIEDGASITIDTLCNVYTTGFFEDTVDFDPDAGVCNLTSNGNEDVFIQKLDANGNFLWVKQMGSFWNENGNAIVVDASGNVYTTGSFEGTVDFDPGAGVSHLNSNNYSFDIFIQKLRVSGIGIIENDFGTEIKLYPNPTNGFFSIVLGKPYDACITITDVTGKTILSKSVENSQRVNLKLEAPAGVYLLIIESAEKKAVIKLVKE